MTRDVRKTVCFAVCIAILLAALGILAWATKGFRNWNAEEWFNYWGKGKPSVAEPDKPSDDSGFDISDDAKDGNAVMTAGDGKGVAFSGRMLARADYAANRIADTADTAYTLTATVQPSYATDKTVDWSVAFVDPESDWATGKTVTDYVTVTPDSDGSATAKVVCLKAFGERIKITVMSRSNPNVTAYCFVDYKEKLLTAALSLSGGEVDESVYTGTWQLADPTTTEFSYALGSKYVNSSFSWNCLLDLIGYDFTLDGGATMHTGYRSIQLRNDGMFFFKTMSSPDTSVNFSDYTAETAKNFKIYIKSEPTVPDETVSDSGQKNTRMHFLLFKDLFEKQPDPVTLSADSVLTVVGGTEYGLVLDCTYSDYTIKREAGLVSSVCDFSLVANFNTLINYDVDCNTFTTTAYPARRNLLLNDTFVINTDYLGRILGLSDSYFTDGMLNDSGKTVVSEVIAAYKTASVAVPVLRLNLQLTDTDGAAMYFVTYSFFLDMGDLKFSVTDVTLDDSAIEY